MDFFWGLTPYLGTALIIGKEGGAYVRIYDWKSCPVSGG